MATVIEKSDKLRRILANLKHMDLAVKIGVQGSEASDQIITDAIIMSPMTLIELAVIHEFGAPSAGIPQRAFIRALADSERPKWVAELGKQCVRAFDDSTKKDAKHSATAALTVLGEKYRTAVIKRMKAGIAPPLKEMTIDRKGSSTPLIDTGALLRSITSVVGPRGGET